MSSSTEFAARPSAAVELTAEGALAAALPGRGAMPVYAHAALPAGALIPGIDEPNLRHHDAVVSAIRSALSEVAPRSRAVTLVTPDTAARVFVLDFDALPSRHAEALSIVRFRLRKMVPFDVEAAGVSYQILSATASECRVLIAVTPGPILAEYEAAVRAAGYEPGAVLPSSLAALAALDTSEAVLAASLSTGALTTIIASGQDLLLYRTLELPPDAASRLAEVQRDIAVAAAYFEDKLARRPVSLHYAGPGNAGEFARWISENEMRVVEFAERPTTGSVTSLGRMNFAGIAGALAGAA